MKVFKMGPLIAVSVVLMVAFCGCGLGLTEIEVPKYEAGALDGYTLLCSTSVYSIPPDLIDMQGNQIRQYSVADGFHAKMLIGGAILTGVERYTQFLVQFEWLRLVQEAWDGSTEWTFRDWEEVPDIGWSSRIHHDWQREGNPVGYYAPGQDYVEPGNTLVLAHADVTYPEISSKPLLDDIVYEIDWGGNPVFEWHAADHVEEFGFDAAAREEIYLRGGDWLHANCVSWLGENPWYEKGDTRFHPRNMIFDSRNAGFIVIIDHQTGDVVWRVGPDYSEPNPEAAAGPFIGLHHAHMIPKGLPGEGDILLFDNGGSAGYGGPQGGMSKYTRDYSRVVEFDPTTVQIVWEYSPANGDFLPFSEWVSGVQRLPNGNTLITSGLNGMVLEVTRGRRIVWECDYSVGYPYFRMYRAYRVPPQWLPENPAGYSPWIP